MAGDRSKTIEIKAVPIDERSESSRPHQHPESALTERALPVAPPQGRELATLTVMTGICAGQVVSIDDHGLSVGRGLEQGLVLDDPALSRRHAVFERDADGVYAVRDLGSTNGTFVSGARIEHAVLTSGDRVQLGPNALLRFAITDETEESLLRRLYESSTKDALTGSYNRKYFFDRIHSEIAYALRHKTAIAVLLIDVDHFKRCNDTYGHLAGDDVLRAIASRLATVVRKEDIVARVGGEELAVLARGGSAVDASRLGERLRAAVEKLEVTFGEAVIRSTISVGVARLDELPPGASVDGNDLFALADTRLYDAKRQGRNRVVDR